MLKRFSRGFGIVLLAACLMAIIAVGFWHEPILDWVVLRNYRTPATIVQLANDTSMTPRAAHLFYVNKPVLEGKQAFNDHCAKLFEQSAVLGCYHGDRLGIYIYNVSDPRLAGVHQVTAAHEMLHQAYDRLSGGERSEINSQLEAYAQTVTDKQLLAKLDEYRKSDPSSLDNEMHSIFGTEVASLPGNLEDYYSQYFADRSKVTVYAASYKAEFTRREQQVAAYDAELASLKVAIATAKAELATEQSALSQKETQLKRTNLSQADIDNYNADVQAYNAKITSTKAKIAEYNEIVARRNTLTVEEQDLQRSLDSRQAPAAK